MGESSVSKTPGHTPREGSRLDVVPSKGFGANCCCLNLVQQYVLLAVTGSFNFGYCLASLNTSLKYIGMNFRWCSDDSHLTSAYEKCEKQKHFEAFLYIAVFVGAAVGCVVGGKTTGFGRRVSMIIMHGIFILGCALCAAAEGFVTMLMARLVVGFGVGFSTVCVPMLISEITPKNKRGAYGVAHQLLITMGIFVAVLLGLAFGNTVVVDTVNGVNYEELTGFQKAWWRIMVGLPILISVPALILFLTTYTIDTPHNLIREKKKNTAEHMLKKIYNRQNVDAEVDEIQQGLLQAEALKKESLSFMSALRIGSYRHVIIVGMLLSAFQQFTGINMLMAASDGLYQASGMGSIATALSTGMTAMNVLMTFPSIYLIEKLGRKTLLLLGCSGQAVALIIASIVNFVDYTAYFAQLTSVAMTFVYVFFFSVAYGPVLWVYLHEIFPAEIKETACSLASALNWVSTVIVMLPALYILSPSNLGIVYCIFAVAAVIAWLIVFFLMKETKGRSIDESPYFKDKPRRVPVAMPAYSDIESKPEAASPVEVRAVNEKPHADTERSIEAAEIATNA